MQLLTSKKNFSSLKPFKNCEIIILLTNIFCKVKVFIQLRLPIRYPAEVNVKLVEINMLNSLKQNTKSNSKKEFHRLCETIR